MSEASLFRGLILGWIALAPVVFFSLFFVSAPYGRHTRGGWGPLVGRTWGWLVMESPAVYVYLLVLVYGGERLGPTALVLTALWLSHYLHRAFVFPFRMHGGSARMPLSVVGMAVVFNLVNGYLQGRQVGHFGAYTADWLTDPRFLGGGALFLLGLVTNLHADTVLLRLRRTGTGDGSHYRVPHGGLFRWVSCANYFGELIEWIGWAVATWSLAGVAFAAWTAANLAPRARTHHLWYLERFPDYPPERRALLPYVF